MAEINLSQIVCPRCGHEYKTYQGYFPRSYAQLYIGLGYIPICKRCVATLVEEYVSKGHDLHDSIRQVCRRLDLYWSEKVFRYVETRSTRENIMMKYIAKLNQSAEYTAKSYGHTLDEEGALWNFFTTTVPESWGDLRKPNTFPAPLPEKVAPANPEIAEEPEEEEEPVSEDIMMFWGPGYTPKMYRELEQRRTYWMSRFPKAEEIDIGTEAIIRQICSLEIDINKDRAAGKSVDKNVNALNTLLGSANLKPVQLKDDSDADLEKMPFGVGLQQWEEFRPLPKVDEIEKDVNHRIKHITTWYVGHAAKMLGLKNSYTQLYEDAMDSLRVKKPEYDDEDDDALITDLPDTDEDGEEA